MTNQQMYALSPKALEFMRDVESRYSEDHLAMARRALTGGDPELLMNPNFGDYADILLQPLLDYATAVRQSNLGVNPQIAAMWKDRVKSMTPEIERLCDLVSRMHALDVGPRNIANRKFAQNKLLPLVLGSSN